MNKEYKRLAIFLLCLIVLKLAFVLFDMGNRTVPTSFLKNLFASVLNTQNIVSLTNASRKDAGLRGLKISAKLESAAQQKAQDMLNNQYFAHNTPSNKTPWDFMTSVGYAYLFAGENLAVNFNSSEDVTNGWLTSPEHRENILSGKYTEIGVGIAHGKFLGADTTFVVQMFGKPLRSSAVATRTTTQKKVVRAGTKQKALLTSLDEPMVKGASVENYIARLKDNGLADWNPNARIYQIYSIDEGTIPMKVLLNILFSYFSVAGVCIVLYRWFKNKLFRDRMLSAYTFLVIFISLTLSVS